METISLSLERRSEVGKGAARRARADGAVPGVYYGRGREAIAVRAGTRDFDRTIRPLEGAHLIETASEDGDLNGRMVLVREIQSHPVSGDTLHFDLLEVPLDHEIEVKVALHFEGRPEGVALGGILQPQVRELSIFCMPTAIPESIDVDVSPLQIGDSLHLSQVALPSGVRPSADDDPALVTVMPPVVDRRDAAEEEGESDGEGGEVAADGAGAGKSESES